MRAICPSAAGQLRAASGSNAAAVSRSVGRTHADGIEAVLESRDRAQAHRPHRKLQPPSVLQTWASSGCSSVTVSIFGSIELTLTLRNGTDRTRTRSLLNWRARPTSGCPTLNRFLRLDRSCGSGQTPPGGVRPMLAEDVPTAMQNRREVFEKHNLGSERRRLSIQRPCRGAADGAARSIHR